MSVGSALGLLALGRVRFRLSVVKGESMSPRLASGDLLVIDTGAYAGANPQRGEIVVANDGNDLIVKRLVGLPGERIEVRRGRPYVNGSRLVERYRITPGRLTVRTGRLLDDTYALLGDNRSLPAAVSVHAVLPRGRIVGKVVYSLGRGLG